MTGSEIGVTFIASGVGAVALYLYLYSGRVPRWLRRTIAIGDVYIIFGLCPGGVGSVVLGTAFLVNGHDGLSVALLLGGLGLMAFAMILWFWAPRLARPPFMRIRWYDFIPRGAPPPEWFDPPPRAWGRRPSRTPSDDPTSDP